MSDKLRPESPDQELTGPVSVKKAVTYSSYLRVEELLKLQTPLSDGPEHDELLFIVIHQVYELWFKQILHELDRIDDLFRNGLRERPHRAMQEETPAILMGLRRTLTILKTMVAQVDVLETMTPMNFNSFRDRLESASGFQSPQFRELEFLLGHRNAAMVRFHRENSAASERLKARLEAPSLYQSFLTYLARHDYGIPAELLEPQNIGPPEVDERICDVLKRVYHESDQITQVCERLVDFDEGLQEWRYRHVKMVERTIGTKQGTGGSGGAEYLKRTLFMPVFPDLWAIRAEL